MADEREDLRLNTLNRFHKVSERLILEEYSHCEVPAGCGGVVLRWRDPAEGIPLSIAVATVGEVEVLVDGVPVVANAFQVAPGEHQVVIEVTGLPDHPTPAIVVIAPEGPNTARNAVLLRSGADGPIHDGAGEVVSAFVGDIDAVAGRRRWWFRRQLGRGATALHLPPKRATLHLDLNVPAPLDPP